MEELEKVKADNEIALGEYRLEKREGKSFEIKEGTRGGKKEKWINKN